MSIGCRIVFPTDDAIIPAIALEKACLFSLDLAILKINFKSDILIVNEEVLNVIDRLLDLVLPASMLPMVDVDRHIPLHHWGVLLFLFIFSQQHFGAALEVSPWFFSSLLLGA